VESDRLHRHYIELVQRAAACGALPDGGLTPREQGAVLGRVDGVGAERTARLIALVERGIYGDGASDEERDDARALCTALAAMLPDPPPPPPPSRPKAARQIPWPILSWAMIGLGGIAVAVLVSTGMRSCSVAFHSMPVLAPPSIPAVGLRERQASVALERRSVDAQRGADWPAPPSSATWSTITAPSVLDAGALVESSAVDFDRVTGVDGAVRGDDPFRPPLGWTHRHFVYDTIAPDFSIVSSARLDRGDGHVLDEAAARDAHGSRPAAHAMHQATVMVRAGAGAAVPIPSPSADGLVQSSTPANVRFVKDANDMLYAIVPTSRTVTLVYVVSTRDDYEAAPLPTTPFVADMLPMPENVRASARVVIDAIGGLPQPTYEATVRRLHAYFAGFSVSPLRTDEQRANDYLSIALSRKGVCRHRARAFMITATAVGIETRLVENFAHSFCEVRLPDGTWRRLEFRLGDDELPPEDPAAARPGASDYLADTADSVATIGLLPLVLLALAGLLWGRWRDIHGHRIGAAPMSRRSPLRSARSDHAEVCRAVALPLATFAIDRLRRHVGADATEDWVARLRDRAAPPMLVARARTLAVALEDPADTWTWEDAHSLQRLFWAAWGVLDWIHRQEKR